MDSFPPKERYEYERIKNLSKQKWIRKFPPLAVCGEDSYQRIKNHVENILHSSVFLIYIFTMITCFIYFLTKPLKLYHKGTSRIFF